MKNKKNKKIRGIQLFLVLFTTLVVGGAIGISAVSHVNAANVSGFSYSGLSATYDKGTWSATEGVGDALVTYTGKATTTSSSGCSGTKYTTVTATLTLKNTSGGTRYFKCSITGNNCSALKYNGTACSSGDNYSLTLANNATRTFTFTTAANNTNESSITVQILSYDEVSLINVSFLSDDTYSYSVDSHVISPGDPTYVVSNKYNVDDFILTFSATLPSGYTFVGWYDLTTSSFLASNTTSTLKLPSGAAIIPKYVKLGTTYKVDDITFSDLNDAAGFALSSSSKTVGLAENATLPAGTFTIPAGVNFVVPFDANYTRYTDIPETVVSAETRSAYRTLTLSSGTNLVIKGSLYVPSKVQSGCAYQTGPYGAIKTVTDSLISLEAGSALYCYGYIWGDGGLVHAKPGSIVYEPFQLSGWRGGTVTSGISENSQKVFPVNSYYIQNIETKLRIDAGAIEYGYTSIYASKTQVGTNFMFIGDSGMFLIKSGYVTKQYIPEEEMLEVYVYGEVTLSSIKITLTISLFIITTTYKLDSSSYILPIKGGMRVIITNGSTMNTGQDIEFHPSSELIIDDGGEFVISEGNKLTFYDTEGWYCIPEPDTAPETKYYFTYSNKKTHVVPYSPNSKKGKSLKFQDAKVDLNGSFVVGKDAGLYTVGGEAEIISSNGTGHISFINGQGSNPNRYQIRQYGSDGTDYEFIDQSSMIVKAQLKHGTPYQGEEYFDTTDVYAGQDVQYNKEVDAWGVESHVATEFDVEYIDENSGASFIEHYKDDETYDIPTSEYAKSKGFSNNDYDVIKWVGDNVEYIPGQPNQSISVSLTSLTAFWGGWDADQNYYLHYLDSNNQPQKPTGLFKINGDDSIVYQLGIGQENISISGLSICLFDDGNLVTSHEDENEWIMYNESDDNLYYLDRGVVQNDYGLLVYRSKYYYVLSDNHLAKDGYFRVSKLNGLDIEPGYYYFDSNGVMDVNHTHSEPKANPTSIHDDVAYVTYISPDSSNNVVASNYGLFALNGYLYYAGVNGELIISTSFFVNSDMLNGCTINGTPVVAGLYYFDKNGHMYDDQLNLIENGGQS